jgi:aminoglycoside N3'-acetyltransferase
MPDVPTIDRLADQLTALGLAQGDTVMVHASLRAVGPVEAGAAGLITALDRSVGPDGSLLMVLGARDDWAWVNERPEDERAALLADAEPFDVLTTPAEPDVGTLAEVFRTHPGTRVSDHPEGRFAARGRLAEWLTADPPWNDYFGPGSPLDRLLAADGKVLRLGADPDTVTLLHHAEYLAPLPSKRRARRHRRVMGPNGPEVRDRRMPRRLERDRGSGRGGLLHHHPPQLPRPRDTPCRHRRQRSLRADRCPPPGGIRGRLDE